MMAVTTDAAGAIRAAAHLALSLRLRFGYTLETPCDIYELIKAIGGIDLQFVDIPSLEGLYLDDYGSHRICVGIHRPVGRQRFTAAHELGHHAFGHGTHLDLMGDFADDSEMPEEEQIADAFGSYLLMPRRAVCVGLRLSEQPVSGLTPLGVFKAAAWLGVSYGGLLRQMHRSLNLIGARQFASLNHVPPKEIKSQICLQQTESDVWPLDEMWRDRTLHCRVGDLIHGLDSVAIQRGGPMLRASAEAGVARANSTGCIETTLKRGGSLLIKVCRTAYVGFYEYRYLPEEPE